MVREFFIFTVVLLICGPTSADQIGMEDREPDQTRRVTEAELAQIRLNCQRVPKKACILRDAFQTALTIETPDIRDTALASIVQAHLSSGVIRVARQASRYISNEEMRAEIKRYFANKFAESRGAANPPPSSGAAEAVFNRSMAQIEVAAEIADAGDFEKALELAKSFTHPFARAAAQSVIARLQAKAGNIEDALETAESIPFNVVAPALHASPQGDALYEIALVQLERGNITDALATVRKIKVIHPHVIPMAHIIRAQLKSGDVAAAIDTVNSLTDRAKYRLLDMGNLYGAWDAPSPTKEMLRRTVELMRGVERSSQCADADPSHKMDCDRLRKEIRTVQTKLNDPRGQPPKTPVERAVSGDIQGALKMAAAIDDTRSKRSETQREIAIIIAKKGDVERARSLTKSIRDDAQRDQALAVMSDLRATAGQIEEAMGLARSIKRNTKRGLTLNGIAKLLAERGKINEGLALANGIKSSAWRSQTVGEIAVTMAEAGRIADAISLAQSITKTTVSDRTFETLVRLQGKSGNLKDALSTLQNVANAEVRVRSLVSLAQFSN